MINVFSMILPLHSTLKNLKIILSEYQNIKPFFNLYDWVGIEYSTTINKNNYTSFEKKIIPNLLRNHANIYKSNNPMYQIIIMKERKSSFVINS